MKIHIAPTRRSLQPFVERLPGLFDKAGEGETLHTGRNTVRAFEAGGEQLVVKRFKRPNLFRAVIYTWFRKSKARRAYEHAERLRGLGIGSPEPVAWSEYRRRGLLCDSYLVTLRSHHTPLSQTTPLFPAPETHPVLDAFARFAARLHEAGIRHEDFNHGNVLWELADGAYDFELIDINRMRFSKGPLGMRASLVNLRRLSCPAPAFLYILVRYAEARGWNGDDTVLKGVRHRLLFLHRRRIKKRLRKRLRGNRQKGGTAI